MSSLDSCSRTKECWKKGVAIFVKYKNEKGEHLYTVVNKSQLKRYMELHLNHEGDNPTIEKVAVYKTKLNNSILKLASPVVYHAFVVLKLKDYYISFDKHDTGLTIQVSDEKDYVLSNFRNEPRYGVPELIIEDDSNKKLKDLIHFYVEKDFVAEQYNSYTGVHCKKFAGDIFKEAAKLKDYNWEKVEILAKKLAAVVPVTLTIVGGLFTLVAIGVRKGIMIAR